MSEDEVLTGAGVALRLGLTPRRVAELARSGRLPSVVVGSARRYFWGDVVASLKVRPASLLPSSRAAGRPARGGK